MRALKPPSASSLYSGQYFAPPKPPVTPRKEVAPQAPHRSAMPTGPKRYRLDADATIVGGPGTPPVGFVTATTSAVEWMVYWAMTKIKGPEGPASGWAYQDAAGGGRSIPGGSILDFLVFDRVPRLAIRVQTERFHQAFGSRQQGHDIEQMITLQRLGYDVQNIWDQDFINDKSGKAVIRVLLEVLAGVHQRDPIATGNSLARA
jgi:hypothetical protein